MKQGFIFAKWSLVCETNDASEKKRPTAAASGIAGARRAAFATVVHISYAYSRPRERFNYAKERDRVCRRAASVNVTLRTRALYD